MYFFRPDELQKRARKPAVVGPATARGREVKPVYAWTDLTDLMHHKNLSRAYYVDEGTQPDC